MKRILCFGDSYTYGQVPGTEGSGIERYDENTRWTGVLQQKLGNSFVVIEEGLPSRTIDLEDPRPNKLGRNGKLYVRPCIESQLPLSAIILWLGTNDTKVLFNRSAADIAESMHMMLREIQEVLTQRGAKSKIILVAPPPFDETNEMISTLYEGALEKIKELSEEYKNLAGKLNVYFVNLYNQLEIPDSKDGIHLTEEQNKQVALILYDALKVSGLTV